MRFQARCWLRASTFGVVMEISILGRGSLICDEYKHSMLIAISLNGLSNSVLSFAACTGKRQLVEYLVKKTPPGNPLKDGPELDMNYRDFYGNSILHLLAYWGDWEMYKSILTLCDKSLGRSGF